MNRRNKGISAIYMMVYMVVISALCSLAVDYGRVQLVKTELHRAADAAARAGAAGIPTDTGTAASMALQYAKKNLVDGTPLVLDSSKDIEFGFWDSSKNTFDNTSQSPNAIHVTAKRIASRGTAVPMMFASLLGFKSCDVHAEAIVMVIPPVVVNQNVLATSNPFLAGMKKGTRASYPNPHSNPDFAGDATSNDPSQLKASPQTVNMQIVGGETMTFDSIDGTARHDPNLAYYNPDGQTDDSGWGHNINNTDGSQSSFQSKTLYNENGIADMNAPINSLVGVFLDDNDPSKTPAPANLDFSTPGGDTSKLNFSQLQPKLKQIFFIGDGLDANGNHQTFIAPQGATRLYLATWDFYEWNNNAGYRNIQINRPMQIITVK